MKKLLIITGVVLALVAVGVTAWRVSGDSVVNRVQSEAIVEVKEFAGDNRHWESLAVSGMADEAAQKKINSLLGDFGQPPCGEPPDDNWRYDSKVGYAIVGDCLSVTRSLTTTSLASSAWPLKEFSAMTLQLSGGEVYTFPLNAATLRKALNEGKFRQVHPEKPVKDGLTQLADSIKEEFIPPYYLTETGVGLYLNGPDHDEGEFWLFEADYADLPPFSR